MNTAPIVGKAYKVSESAPLEEVRGYVVRIVEVDTTRQTARFYLLGFSRTELFSLPFVFLYEQ